MINRKKNHQDVERGTIGKKPPVPGPTRGGGIVTASLIKMAGVLIVMGMIFFAWNQYIPKKTYAVVIDAGSTGSRIHVYQFNAGFSGVELKDELFEQLKPGLSSYAKEPAMGAASLKPLLKHALDIIPKSEMPKTPVMIGATAGLRMLPGTAADELLEESRSLLRKEYSFKPFADSAVSVMSGDDEGKFAWLAVNMLTKKLGAPAGKTVGVIDLGGGSVQMMRALEAKGKATAVPEYVTATSWQGKKYDLYVNSFLGFGLKAGRMAVLKQEGAAKACMPQFAAETYKYNNEEADATGGEGSNFDKCRAAAVKALDVDKPCEVEEGCAFGGKWGAIEPGKPKEFFLLSYLYERIEQAGAGEYEPDEGIGVATVDELAKAASRVCSMSLVDLKTATKAGSIHPEDPPYFCLDLSYIHALLTAGFRIDGRFKMAKKFDIDSVKYEAAWSLGAALEML